MSKAGACILIDDIVDSGGTLCNAAEALLKNGATEVYAYCTHGVLSGKAVERIKNSRLKSMVVTDSIAAHRRDEGLRQYPHHLHRAAAGRGDAAHQQRSVCLKPV